jgi:hypothetical protein
MAELDIEVPGGYQARRSASGDPDTREEHVRAMALLALPRGTGSEISFTLFRRPEMTDEKFSQDAQWVDEDLNILKGLLEKQGGTP